MKSNVVMKSEQDRNLFDYTIRQETKTGFMNLSDLSEAYTRKRIVEGWSEKRIDNIFNYKDNHERIYYILKNQGVINTSWKGFIELELLHQSASITRHIRGMKIVDNYLS